jgi:hypothetical protein
MQASTITAQKQIVAGDEHLGMGWSVRYNAKAGAE